MTNKIITLSNYLREKGMDVSVRSTITASWIYDNYQNQFNTSELKEALQSVYVKDKKDIRTFNITFNSIFINKLDEKLAKKENKTSIDVEQIQYKKKNKEEHSLNKPRKNQTTEDILRRRRITKKTVDNSVLSEDIIRLNNIDTRVFNLCNKLSKKIANQRSKRKKRYKSKQVSIPKTIRANLKNGGHLINLINQKPPRRKSRHIFLCDISGSCEWATSWFFAILYGCYTSFDRMIIYDFDNRIVNVSEAIHLEYNNTFQINHAHKSMGLRPRSHSNMGKAFKEFLDKAPLNLQTDVIILTDCRDWNGKIVNNKLESAILLKQIVKRSHRVIILNPENKIRWNTPTSCVREYQDAGVEVYETTNLNQFAKVISKL